MKVLTAAQMREVDRRTIEAGIPGIVLMENAGHRVVEFLSERFAPLEDHRIVVVCGKGNNGGDGLVVARQLFTRFHPRKLHVVMAADPGEMKGDAAQNVRMLRLTGLALEREITPEMRLASLVIDALLGTGLRGPAEGDMVEWIRRVNDSFPLAKIVAVDVPSGMQSDTGRLEGEVVTAQSTVTFTAPKVCHVLSPAAERCGEVRVAAIGSPPEMFESDGSISLSFTQPAMFRELFAPREVDSNKGRYGHVLVIAGGRGKTGAAALAGIGALRAGAGLTTVASAESAIATIASHASELMTAPLRESEEGAISYEAFEQATALAEKKPVVALGPGMGTHGGTVEFVRKAFAEIRIPMVVDADGLNALAGSDFRARAVRILTPHPGEMARLASMSIDQVQEDRVETARRFARERGVCLVLKGHRSIVAFADGRAFVNPTNTPALATGGTGDVLTGMIAGLVAQFPDRWEKAVLAAVYLHGRAGQLGAEELGEKSFIASDILRYLPKAMREVAEGRNPTLA